jgi:hypothetical protein
LPLLGLCLLVHISIYSPVYSSGHGFIRSNRTPVPGTLIYSACLSIINSLSNCKEMTT